VAEKLQMDVVEKEQRSSLLVASREQEILDLQEQLE
jgi:hypothetical protein